jgi:uncharacterized protein YbcI
MTEDLVADSTNTQDDVSTRNASSGGGGSVAQRIAAGTVTIYKEHLGRGPTRARTTLHENMVVTVLADSLTKAELTLTAQEQGDTVRAVRRLMQDAMERDMRKLIETELHRKVICLLSDHCPEPDYAVEVLLLAPSER